MTTVLLVIHLMIAASLVGVVLVQRSEGGALGIGGGGGGNFMTGRGTANLLTRITAALAVGFFATSLLLSILAGGGGKPTSILDQLGGQGTTTSVPATSAPATEGTTTTGGTTTDGSATTDGTAAPAMPSVPQSQ